MALSEIIINDVIRVQTNTVISGSTYQALRQYLLERKPLSAVTDAVGKMLNEHYSTDKQAIICELTKAANDAQKLSDGLEARADEQEKNNDALLRASYIQELPGLSSQKSLLESQIDQQQNYYRQIQSSLTEYKINRSQTEQSIAQIKNEKAEIMAKYEQPQETVHVHNEHQHAHASQVHTHSHGTTPTHTGQILNTLPLSLYDKLTIESLNRKENQHNNELARQTALIGAKEADLYKEEQKLSVMVTQKSSVDVLYNERMRQLNTDLPQRERLRQARSQTRFARAHAREIEDRELRQLSDENRGALAKRITAKIAELDKTRDSLIQKATACSYSIFIDQLVDTLEAPTAMMLTYNEREALKFIVSMMRQYSEMEKKEQIISTSLLDAKSTLKSLQQKLDDSTRKLQSHERTNPQLERTNKELAEENVRLRLASNSADDAETDALLWSLFSGMATGISIAVISALVVSPVFFAISGALALATVISLTVAAVYHFQKSDYDDKIDGNNETILSNKATISQNYREAAELRATTIPTLRTKIDEAQKSVGLIAKELQEHQQEMEQLFSKAQKVTEFQSSSHNFFAAPPKPSAPPLHPAQSLPQFESADYSANDSFVMVPGESAQESLYRFQDYMPKSC